MNNELKEKLNIVYYPFLQTMIGTFVFYTLLRWLIEPWFEQIPIINNFKEYKFYVINFIAPAIITYYIFDYFMGCRIYFLAVEDKREDSDSKYRAPYFYSMMITAITLSIILSQECAVKFSHGLTQLETPAQFLKTDKQSYLAIDSFEFDKKK